MEMKDVELMLLAKRAQVERYESIYTTGSERIEKTERKIADHKDTITSKRDYIEDMEAKVTKNIADLEREIEKRKAYLVNQKETIARSIAKVEDKIAREEERLEEYRAKPQDDLAVRKSKGELEVMEGLVPKIQSLLILIEDENVPEAKEQYKATLDELMTRFRKAKGRGV